ncbi:O(6)-alkylguanine repair protein YbaZ [Solimonas aquatica]|uniref:O(6)-alkylguanine repair protein YbaZ n=1 Tax=Solimonas aquatica TaxID=489703 RepID=A0A1H9KQP6_9GAMM|nr:methylated-DNA--[protein]-cysteine S-methyltransferase [Solimonas aquatica]SER01491.1 O(6)-alkylguanine repair protein YbaZ [Solimonas aquatica]
MPREPADTAHQSYVRIWAQLKKIPRGRVVTYGQLAELAGLPRAARLAGYALHHLPENSRLPWHRVLNAQGRLSFPLDSEGYRRQQALLAAEGVVMLAGRVDLGRYRWQPRSAAPVLD